MNPLFDAVANRDDAAARALAERDPDLRVTRDADGLLPATRALYARSRELAESLLPQDEALDIAEAAAFGRTGRLAALLDEDPGRVDELSPDGFTPLHLTCFAGGEAATRLLVERGANLERLADSSFARVRPLGTAAFSGDVDSARVLLEAGASPDGRGEGGFTPLHSAAQNGNLEFVRLLLEHGADTAARLPDGRTAADVAREAGHDDLAAELEAQ